MEGAYEWMIRWEGRNTQRHVGPQAPLTQWGAAQLYWAILQGREIQHYYTSGHVSSASSYEKLNAKARPMTSNLVKSILRTVSIDRVESYDIHQTTGRRVFVPYGYQLICEQ